MILCADAISLPFPDLSVDLVFGSPPYCEARTYGIGAQWDCVTWVNWMLDVTTEAMRVSRNCVVWVAAGVTRDRNYWPAVEGLMWLWWSRGGKCQLYRPCIYHRVGIPGSGGDDWFRSDWEFCVCFKRPGPLPWTDNTAMGHPPKYAPGGEMSYRMTDGQRRGQQGGSLEGYAPPAIANPGNVICCKVGGGAMGSNIAHENEAPFPEKLAEFFVRSLCPPGGIVLDPFSGSGTTSAVAQRFGRKFIASDLRESQAKLTRRRQQNNQLALMG